MLRVVHSERVTYVYAHKFCGNGSKWILGKVVAMTGPVSMVIVLTDGWQVRHH